ncbi:hypothetical protein Tco_1061356 [Tanacetum coccineum]
MEGTEMTKQERESMLYDEFDKFTSKPGESIHSYYLRFVTAAKQARDLQGVTFDQLYAFLKHNEKDAKESPPLQSYAPTVLQQPPTYQPDTGLAILTFLPSDDPIKSLNKAMIFLSLVYRSKFPPTNNQLRTSSNPRTQAIIQNDQVTVQNVQGRHSQGYTANAGNNQASGAWVINTVGNAILDYEATTNAIFMANFSPVGSLNDDTVQPRYDSDILSERFIVEVKEMKDIFEQMEDEVDQCSVAKKSFKIKKKQLLINNDRLLEENIASDIMCTYSHSLNEVDNCGKCKSLDIVLLDLQESNKSLSELIKRFAQVE